MSMRTAWRPEADEAPVVRTAKEVLDEPPRRWPLPLMVLVAVLLGMGAGAWVAGNNERALDATAERLVEVSEQLESAHAELSAAQAELVRLQGVERVSGSARRDNAAALEDLEQVVFAAAEMFDALPAGSTADLAPAPRDLGVLERNVAAAQAQDASRFRDTFTRDGRVTYVFAGLHQELRGDEMQSLLFPEQVRLVGTPAQIGGLLWSRYRETTSSGVVVSRIEGDRIQHQWHVALRW